jgi:uncharacterized phiE125 gp8 family phage protein
MRFLDWDTVTGPAALPVTVDEFVDHGRLNGLTVDRQPDLIDRELTAATSRAEHYLRRSLITQTLKALYLPDDSDDQRSLVIVLPRGNVQAVNSISSAGAAIDPATYKLEWNTVTLGAPIAGAATVEFTSGYGDAGSDVPDQIREGILQYATTLYEGRTGERQTKFVATAERTLPAGVIDLWRPFQIELSG